MTVVFSFERNFRMGKYAIITDSASDLSKAYRDANNIDYAKTTYSYEENGKLHELAADLDWECISCKEFYDVLRRGIRIFTAQVTAQEYLDVFIPHLEKGEDILYVACSSGLSASLKAAQLLAETELKEKYPDRKVIVVDTLRAGMAQGSIVMLAVDLMKQGKSIEENANILEREKVYYKEVGIPETLSYLRRAGRVKVISSVLNQFLSLMKKVAISQ